MLHDQSPRKNVAGLEDRTRHFLNISRMRIRPSYGAQLVGRVAKCRSRGREFELARPHNFCGN